MNVVVIDILYFSQERSTVYGWFFVIEVFLHLFSVIVLEDN